MDTVAARGNAPGGALVPVDNAAVRLSLSRSQVYRLVERGELRGVRFGRSVRVYEDAIEEYIRSHPAAS